MNKLWIVGQIKVVDGVGWWEFQGVFDDESKAAAACRDETYFIGPATLNEERPHETTPQGWVGAYYPKAEQK